jgi:hypothetical protein
MYSIEENGEEEAIQDMDVSQELEIPKPLVRLRVCNADIACLPAGNMIKRSPLCMHIHDAPSYAAM